MGAFGRLLQARLGGTKHDVSTWSDTPKTEQSNEKKPPLSCGGSMVSLLHQRYIYGKIDYEYCLSLKRKDFCCESHWVEFTNRRWAR